MGRTASPKKPTTAARSLSSRLAAPTLDFSPSAPSPLSISSFAPSAAQSSPSSSATMPAQKRTFDDASAGPATPLGGATKKPKRRGRKPKVPVTGALGKTKPAGEVEDGEIEEGEVVEGDFSDLFMVDTTPAAVREEARFVVDTVGEPTPVKGKGGDDDELLITRVGKKGGDEAEEEEEQEEDDKDEDTAMRLFAKEVQMTEDEDSDGSEGESDEDSESEEGVQPEALLLYDDEAGLRKAIQGKIVDDSSAPVTGRYYKEADLTKTCVLCGGALALPPFPPHLLSSHLVSSSQSTVTPLATARTNSASSAVRSTITKRGRAPFRSFAQRAALEVILRGSVLFSPSSPRARP